MACLFLILTLLFPRAALAVLFFFTHYLSHAFHDNLLLLVAGFLFLPLTTLVYAWMVNSGMPAEGVNLLFPMIAVLLDLGLVGGGYRQHRSQA